VILLDVLAVGLFGISLICYARGQRGNAILCAAGAVFFAFMAVAATR
jgi:hypothetical protein